MSLGFRGLTGSRWATVHPEEGHAEALKIDCQSSQSKSCFASPVGIPFAVLFLRHSALFQWLGFDDRRGMHRPAAMLFVAALGTSPNEVRKCWVGSLF